jgi:hypothetical protein
MSTDGQEMNYNVVERAVLDISVLHSSRIMNCILECCTCCHASGPSLTHLLMRACAAGSWTNRSNAAAASSRVHLCPEDFMVQVLLRLC